MNKSPQSKLTLAGCRSHTRNQVILSTILSNKMPFLKLSIFVLRYLFMIILNLCVI